MIAIFVVMAWAVSEVAIALVLAARPARNGPARNGLSQGTRRPMLRGWKPKILTLWSSARA